MEQFILNGQPITIEEVVQVARSHRHIVLGQDALHKVEKAREKVEIYVEEGRVIYGITTGFGKFSDQLIAREDVSALQSNLIKSHACGVGEPFKKEIVRAMMLLRVQSLLKGCSGITLTTLQLLVNLVNHDIIPYIPCKGSLGASGDLAPLAHMALVLIGEGKAYYKDVLMPAKQALTLADLTAVTLRAKEGLALINGTQALTAVGLLTAYDASALANMADVVLSCTMSGLRGVRDAFDARIHAVRPHPGQIQSAANVWRLTEGNTYVTAQNELRVQDAYALRCAAQVHGASRDAMTHINEKITIEINSVTDNPLLFVEDDVVFSGGNFHGQSVAMAFDYMGIAIAELANISERRLERLVNPALSNNLPAFLTNNGGVESGFMIVQYSAAALVSENKVLAHPASVDSIPSSANQEDHVSMGMIAARKANTILDHATKVLAMEWLAAMQAIDMREPAALGALQPYYDRFRQSIPYLQEDVILYELLEKSEQILIECMCKHQGGIPTCN